MRREVEATRNEGTRRDLAKSEKKEFRNVHRPQPCRVQKTEFRNVDRPQPCRVQKVDAKRGGATRNEETYK